MPRMSDGGLLIPPTPPRSMSEVISRIIPASPASPNITSPLSTSPTCSSSSCSSPSVSDSPNVQSEGCRPRGILKQVGKKRGMHKKVTFQTLEETAQKLKSDWFEYRDFKKDTVAAIRRYRKKRRSSLLITLELNRPFSNLRKLTMNPKRINFLTFDADKKDSNRSSKIDLSNHSSQLIDPVDASAMQESTINLFGIPMNNPSQTVIQDNLCKEDEMDASFDFDGDFAMHDSAGFISPCVGSSDIKMNSFNNSCCSDSSYKHDCDCSPERNGQISSFESFVANDLNDDVIMPLDPPDLDDEMDLTNVSIDCTLQPRTLLAEFQDVMESNSLSHDHDCTPQNDEGSQYGADLPFPVDNIDAVETHTSCTNSDQVAHSLELSSNASCDDVDLIYFSSRMHVKKGTIVPVLPDNKKEPFWLFEVTQSKTFINENESLTSTEIKGFFLEASGSKTKGRFSRNPKMWKGVITPDCILQDNEGNFIIPRFSCMSGNSVTVDSKCMQILLSASEYARNR